MNIRTALGVVHSELLHILEVVRFRFSRSIQQFKRSVKIFDTDETISKILSTHCSVSRFGDGEFYVMNGGGNGFQHSDKRLQQRLIEVFESQEPNLLVCIPYTWVSQSNLKHTVKVFYTRFLLNHTSILQRINCNRQYGDALFSRFYMDYADKGMSKKRIERIKEIWKNRDVYVVEGVLTRMGVGNDLFAGAKSVKRILGPSKSAFDKYDELMSVVKKLVPKNANSLILIAMGMTATVMSYDLCRAGYQAIDIGHLDVEYEWMLMGAKNKVAIPSRFVNEANNYSDVEDCKDEAYRAEIIAEVK